MKSLGIVRKIDNLGRIVLPKELRKVMNLEEGTKTLNRLSVCDECINKLNG